MRTRYVFLMLVGLSACATNSPPQTPPVADPKIVKTLPLIHGAASYYGVKGERLNRFTSSGEPFNAAKLTAAHRTLPFGTKVRVTNIRNGETVVVRITDRGPAKWTKREIDLTVSAAKELDMIASGVAPVSLQVVK